MAKSPTGWKRSFDDQYRGKSEEQKRRLAEDSARLGGFQSAKLRHSFLACTSTGRSGSASFHIVKKA
jgi:hypothetical protein